MINKLDYSFYSIEYYFLIIFVFLATYFVLKILRNILSGHFKRLNNLTKVEISQILSESILDIKSLSLIVFSAYITFKILKLPENLFKAITLVFLLFLVYEVIRMLQGIIFFFVYKSLKKDNDELQAKETAKTFNIFIQIILWSFGLLLVLSNIGINISSLLAGLGIGGIAVALALQNILGDIFSSFSILIDKPFQVGDFIRIGAESGVVQKIGIKTTHLQTLDGQSLIIANRELTTARVENFRQVKKRRALFTLGVVYETSQEHLEEIPKIIKELVEKHDLSEFDRCHFKSYGDFSLNFEVSFYVAVEKYKDFLDVVERVNLDIFKSFKERGINFAYPTAVHYKKNI